MQVMVQELNKNVNYFDIENIQEIKEKTIQPTEVVPIGAAVYQANIVNTKRLVVTTVWYHDPDADDFNLTEQLEDSVWKEIQNAK